jgi:hypothetical protein
MGKVKKNSITRKLPLSFSLLILLFLFFGIYTLYDVSIISKLTRTIYNHPLIVSNAASQSNVAITKIHRNMKDIVLFKDPGRVRSF